MVSNDVYVLTFLKVALVEYLDTLKKRLKTESMPFKFNRSRIDCYL